MNNKLKILNELKTIISGTHDGKIKDWLIELVQDKETSLMLEKVKSQMHSERKFITLLFADISGFTAMSERLDPEQVKNLLNSCFDVLVPIIEKHGGYIDKFIGDEIMALFGAPIARENFTSSALMAALEMMEELHTFNIHQNIKLDMHIGINSGLVVTGGLGSKGKLQYTVIGDTVNVASRLEGLAQNGEIIVGEETYLKTREEFDFKALSKIQVKGKKGWLQPYILKGKKNNKLISNNPDTSSEKLWGRKKELTSIIEYIDNSINTRQSFVIKITGESGIGKSRLVKALLNEKYLEMKWLAIKVYSFQKTHNFSLIKTLITILLEIENEFNQEDLKARLNEKFPKSNTETINLAYYYLALLFNFTLHDEEQKYINNQNSSLAKSTIENTIISLLNVYCKEKNTCIVIEDISWLDESSFGILKSLFQRDMPYKLGIILVDRNESLVNELLDKKNAKHLQLHGLQKQAARLLLKEHYKIEFQDTKLVGDILKLADGNPFYLKELASYYAHIKNNKTEFKESFRNTSNNLQQLLITKFDQLSKFQKIIVQSASIMGNVFRKDFLLNLMIKSGYKNVEIESSIESLINSNILESTAGGYLQFKSSIYADVAYQNLLKSKRITIHKAFAAILIKFSNREQKNISLDIANHLELANQFIDAIPFFIETIEYALQFSSTTEAHDLINRLLHVLEEARNLGYNRVIFENYYETYQEKKANCLIKMSRIENAVEIYENLIKLNGTHNRLRKAHYYTQISFAYKIIRKGKEIKKHANNALKILDKVENKKTNQWNQIFLEAKNALMWGYYFSQEIEALNSLVDSMEHLNSGRSSHVQKTDMYFAKATSQVLHNFYTNVSNDTLVTTENGLKEARLSNNKMLLAIKYAESGFIYTWTKYETKAKEYLLASIKLSEECYYIEPWITSLNYLGYLYRKNRDIKNLQKHLQIGIRLAEQSNNHYLCPIYGTYLLLKLTQNQINSCSKIVQKIELNSSKLPANYPLKFMWLGPLYRYYFNIKNYQTAKDCLEKSIEYGQKKWDPKFTSLLENAIQYYTKSNLQMFAKHCQQIIQFNDEKKLGYC